MGRGYVGKSPYNHAPAQCFLQALRYSADAVRKGSKKTRTACFCFFIIGSRVNFTGTNALNAGLDAPSNIDNLINTVAYQLCGRPILRFYQIGLTQ